MPIKQDGTDGAAASEPRWRDWLGASFGAPARAASRADSELSGST